MLSKRLSTYIVLSLLVGTNVFISCDGWFNGLVQVDLSDKNVAKIATTFSAENAQDMTKAALDTINKNLPALAKTVKEQLPEVVDAFKKEIPKLGENLENELSKRVSHVAEAVRNEIPKLGEKFGNELNKRLASTVKTVFISSLGTAGSITGLVLFKQGLDYYLNAQNEDEKSRGIKYMLISVAMLGAGLATILKSDGIVNYFYK